MDAAYFAALAADTRLGRTDGIDGALQTFKIDALVLPTSGAAGPAAIAGYPIVTGEFKFYQYVCLSVPRGDLRVYKLNRTKRKTRIEATPPFPHCISALVLYAFGRRLTSWKLL